MPQRNKDNSTEALAQQDKHKDALPPVFPIQVSRRYSDRFNKAKYDVIINKRASVYVMRVNQAKHNQEETHRVYISCGNNTFTSDMRYGNNSFPKRAYGRFLSWTEISSNRPSVFLGLNTN